MRNSDDEDQDQDGDPADSAARKFYLAAAAIVLALSRFRTSGIAQGIVRGAQEGSREGNRVAGPVWVVWSAARSELASVARWGRQGVFGINDRGYRCRGYYDRRSRFHCYR